MYSYTYIYTVKTWHSASPEDGAQDFPVLPTEAQTSNFSLSKLLVCAKH